MAQQNLKVNISGDSSGLNSALSSASSKLSAFGSKMQSVGSSMTAKLTLPLVAVGAAAVKMAFDFDKSMTSIQALVGVSASEVSKMGESAKRMAIDTGKSANEAAEALFFITSAGLRGDEAMQVLEASLKAAAVGLGETKTIADLSTSALNAYGSENLSASEATDILTAAVREGKLEASALAGTMGGVIPIASNMGVSFNEVAASMAAMSRTGTNAAEGATQLNAILASLKKPTAEAEIALSKMGMSTESVQKSLRENGLLSTLEMLQAGLTKTGQDTTAIFPNIRALKGVLDLTGAGLETNRQIFEALNNTMGATDEAFAKTAESASFKMTKSLNTMKGSLIEVGNVILVALVPAVEKIAGFLTKMSDKFKSLSPTMQNAIVGFAGILAIAGPVIIIFGKLAVGLSALSPLLPVVASGFRLLTAAMIANPILAVAAAIAAIGVAIYSYSKAQKEALKDSLNIVQVEKQLAEKRKKLAYEQQRLADGYGGQVGKNVRILKEEIKILQEKKNVLDKIEKSTKKAASVTTKTTITPTITPTSTTPAVEKRPVAQTLDALDPSGLAKLTPITDGINADTALIPQAMTEQQIALEEQRAIAMEKAAAFNDGINNIITGGLNDLAIGIGQALGKALATGGDLAQSLSKVVLTTIGNMASQMGKLAIGIGIGIEKIKASLASFTGFGAIAAGVALVALGAFASAQAGKIGAGGGGGGGGATPFAKGGIVSGPTMGLVGEYPGAKSNPEVIAPLNKLQAMIGNSGGTQNINVGGQIRLEGQDLLIAIERAQATAGRIY
jgi:TP901 family phage tail tape measure protein